MRKPNLRLNKKQIDSLGKYAEERLQSMRIDNNDRIKADKKSYEIYKRDRTDRAELDTIFEHSNLSLPITSMVIDSFVARADEAITGTAPFFHFEPRGASDRQQAKDFDDYFRFKLDTKAEVRYMMQDGYEPIFIQRAAFFKTIYEEDVDKWMDYEKEVLWNVITGKPIKLMLPGQDEPSFIIKGEHPFVEVEDPATGLVRQQSAILPQFYINEEIMAYAPSPDGLAVRKVRFDGAKAVMVDYDSILVSSAAESIEDADVIEQYDKSIHWAEKMWVNRDGMSFEDFKSSLRKRDADAKTETERNKENKENLSFDKQSHKLKVIECWFKRDVLENGEPQRIVVWVDAETFVPISWEYRSIVVPTGNTPYRAISIAKKPNRWWGPSLVEMVQEIQEYVDKQFNAQSYRNELSANPYQGFDRTALEDDEDDDPETFPGKLFETKAGKTIRDAFSFTEMPKSDQKTQELIDFVIELLQLWLGVSDLSQGDSEQISKHNTATGIEATLREASKLSRKWIRRIVRGYSGMLKDLVTLTIATFDVEEAYEVTERGNVAIRQMRPEDVQNLDFDVTLVMSQNQGGRQIENSRAALETQQYYFDMLMNNPQMALVSRPLMVEILTHLGFPDADILLPAYGQDPAAPEAELQSMQQAQVAKQEREAAMGVTPKQDQKEMLPTR